MFLTLEDALVVQREDAEHRHVRAYPASHGRFPDPMHKGWYDHIVARRHLIPKDALVDGAFYFGRCRNANLAQWDAQFVRPKSTFHKETHGVFRHWRKKFGNVFTETINCCEDDDGFDLFWPVERIWPDEELGVKDIRGMGL